MYLVSACPPERPAYFLSREGLHGPDPRGEQQNQMSTEAKYSRKMHKIQMTPNCPDQSATGKQAHSKPQNELSS